VEKARGLMEFQVRQAIAVVRYLQHRENGEGKMKASKLVAKSLYPECGTGKDEVFMYSYVLICLFIC
jgi:hypothetical protein